jgi:carboxypeptidase T
MKSLKATLAIIWLVMCGLAVQAQQQPNSRKTSRVKIYAPTDRYQRGELLHLLQIDHFYEEDGAIISEINQGDMARLRTTPYRYEVLIDDVGADLRAKNEQFVRDLAAGRVAFEQSGSTINSIIATPSTFTVNAGVFGGYYSFAEMDAKMTAAAAGPNSAFVQKLNIGTSIEGRTIWCMKISDNVGTDDATEPDVLFIGLQHAREAITGSSMIFLMQYLIEQYNLNNTRVRELVNNREIYIVPCFNPDGWEYNRLNGGVGMDQRKNRRNVGSDTDPGQKGVDLNRNWGVDWGNCSAPIMGSPASCGSTDPDDATYWGTGAFSEPETAALRALVLSKNFVVAFDQHAFGPYYSLPFGRRSLHSYTTQQSQFYTAIPALMGQYNGMRANDSYGALGYEVAGGFKDWMLLGEIGLKGEVYGMTGEGGAGGGVSGNNFWAPAGEIINLCKGMAFQNMQLALAAGSYVDLQDASDIALTSLTGTLSFNLKRLGLGNQSVTVSLLPMQNMSSAGAPVVVSLPNYYDNYTGNISYTLPAGLGNGQRVRFRWQITTGGITYYDTVTKFYNPPAALINENFESGFASWGVSTTGTGAVPWGITPVGTGYNGAGRAMSESPAAGLDYTTSTARRVFWNAALPLADATAAYLSFWVRHRAENFRDRLLVELSTNSTNGINGTWTAIAGRNTIQEPGTLDGSQINGLPSLTGIRETWTRELYEIPTAFRTATTRLRFSFISDGDPTSFADERDDGFYIDDVKLVKSTSTLVTLAVNFISFTGNLLPSKEVDLVWEATTDREHSYFEVEKSYDQVMWTVIGRVDNNQPFRLLDRNPQRGNNFYRVKAIDVNGRVQYSRTINIVYNSNMFTMSFFPNPVKDELNVTLKTEEPEKLNIHITDMAGRQVITQQAFVTNSGRTVTIDTRSLAGQVYVLKVVNSKNEIVGVEKFVKR